MLKHGLYSYLSYRFIILVIKRPKMNSLGVEYYINVDKQSSAILKIRRKWKLYELIVQNICSTQSKGLVE